MTFVEWQQKSKILSWWILLTVLLKCYNHFYLQFIEGNWTDRNTSPFALIQPAPSFCSVQCHLTLRSKPVCRRCYFDLVTPAVITLSTPNTFPTSSTTKTSEGVIAAYFCTLNLWQRVTCLTLSNCAAALACLDSWMQWGMNVILAWAKPCRAVLLDCKSWKHLDNEGSVFCYFWG